MVKKRRFFPEEVKERFDLKEIIPNLELELSQKLPEKGVNYEIFVQSKFEPKDWEYLDGITRALYGVFFPYWKYRRGFGEEVQHLPLSTEPRGRDEKNLYLPIKWKNSASGSLEDMINQILSEVTAILKIPKELSRSKSELKISGEYDGNTFTIQMGCPKTEELSAFKEEDLPGLRKYYSRNDISELIARFCKGRYPRMQWLDHGIPRFWFWEKPEEELLKIDSAEAVREKAKRNVVTFYTSIDKVGVVHPDILAIEPDPGEMLRILRPDDAHRWSVDFSYDVCRLLDQYRIGFFAQPTGGKSVYVLAGEDFDQPPRTYNNILETLSKNILIKSDLLERLSSQYGFNKVLGKAIGTSIVRKKKDYIRRRYSIDETDKVKNLYKVLIDVPSDEKNAIRCPGSKHANTALVCRRVGRGEILYSYRDRDSYEQGCSEENFLKDLEANPNLYQIIAPMNPISEFDILCRGLRKELFFVTYLKIDPNLSQNFALEASDAKIDELYAEFMK